MCNVCLARKVLNAGMDGITLGWNTQLPPTKLENNPIAYYPIDLDVKVRVRARGDNAEFTPAEYQIIRENEPWPEAWNQTKDLAGSIADYGLDVKWEYVPGRIKDWLLQRVV